VNRLRIPRFVLWASVLAIMTFGGSFLTWSRLVWTPVQRYYLRVYFRCSWPGAHPGSLIRIRWLYKTASGVEPELASKDDAVRSSSISDGGLNMELSPAAREAGWTGLTQEPEERIQIAVIKPRLEDQVLDGQTLFLIVFWPLFCGFLSSYFLVLALNWLEDWLPDAPWRAARFPWEEPAPSVLRRAVKKAVDLRSRLSEMSAHWARRSRQAPMVTAAPAIPSDRPNTSRPSAISPFGASTGTYTEGFLWTEKDEIE
jgi:hypothetical protein